MRRYALIFLPLITFVILTIATPLEAADPFARQPYKIFLSDETELRELSELRLDILRASVGGEPSVEAFLNRDEAALLQALGYRIERIPYEAHEMFLKLKQEGEETGDPMRDYHSYDEIVTELQGIAAANPDLCQLYNIGPTVQGRALWFMKISDNVDIEEDELEFKYISTMHGDEPVGMEMCLNFINMLVDRYGIDPEITDLVNETEIWVMPLMNPDGYTMGTRYNANGVDLNRDFPDRVDDPVNTPAGRAIETQDVMLWNFDHQPVFSANFHTGALVANYPWDHCFDPQANHAYTDDHDVFLAAAQTYSYNNPPMWNNNWGSFQNGTVNGVDWYQISGGMQDWNYVWMGDMDITMELSNISWPPSSALPGLWEDNRDAMIAYIQFAHRGVRGIVTDAVTGLPLAAEIEVSGRDDYVTFTDPDVGDYHRVLMPGIYDLEIRSFGYWSAHLNGVEVFEGEPTRMDVALEPADLMTFSGVLHDPAGGGLNARLVLLDTPYDPVETNASGEFVFTDIYEGEYILRILNLNDDSVIEFPLTINAPQDSLELWGPISIFTDGFEGGLGNWTPEGTWGTSGNAHTGALSAADSPGGSYGNNLNISLTGNSAFDLTEYDYVALSYFVTFNCETNYDTLFAEVSASGGPWTTVNYHNSKQDWWSLEVCDLSAYAGISDLSLRYRLQTDGSVTRDGGFIDDVHLSVASLTPLTQELTVTLTPYGAPIQIPASGGSFDFNIEVANSGGTPASFDAWIDLTLPSGTSYGPLLGPVNLTLPPGESLNRDRTQNIPGNAPAGTYSYNAYVGVYPDQVLSQDSFTFEKVGVDASGLQGWLNEGEDFGATETPAFVLPDHFVLSQNYPNPFNPITRIHFALPEDGSVRLTIYNTAGQKVTTLVDGYRRAGWHEVTWDASDLATGLYIYQLETEGGTLSGKAILVK